MSKCPACGESVTGKFCSNCGATLGDLSCSKCGAALKKDDRFCHKCGAPVRASRDSQSPVPWIVAGAAVVVLALVVIVRFTGSAGPPAQGAAPAAAGPGGAAGPVDLSSMTPREAADRLFERIMIAHEAGNADQVAFFLPMAIQSYQMLEQKDTDAHYHLGLIHTVGGQADAALAQADSVELGAPNHLFASMLRATAARIKGDSAGVRRAYRTFLDSYEGEIATQKPEYSAHQNAIEAFRTEARGLNGG